MSLASDIRKWTMKQKSIFVDRVAKAKFADKLEHEIDTLIGAASTVRGRSDCVTKVKDDGTDPKGFTVLTQDQSEKSDKALPETDSQKMARLEQQIKAIQEKKVSP